MDSKALEKEVAGLELSQNALLGSLDSMVPECRLTLAQAASKWMNAEVERFVTSDYQHVQEMGLDRLREFKAAVTEAIAGVESFVATRTSDLSQWPHRATPAKRTAESGYQEPYLEAHFRTTISTLGASLKQFGFIKAGQTHGGAWNETSPGIVRYAINPGFETRQHPPLANYLTSLNEHRASATRLSVKREELSKAKAKELWNSA